MSFNKAKILKSAEKYVQQGKIPAAIDEYRKIVEADPNDLTMINTLGDLCVRAGRTEEAIQNFSRIAENYRENGFTLKAIAMYKKISKLEPSNFETSLKLADLYSKQGLIVDARQQYLIVADAYKRNGQTKKALEILQKIADLDPENTAVRLKLAESYQVEGLNDQAHDAYVYAGQEFAKKGKTQEAISAFTKAASINSASKIALKSLADAYVQQNDPYRAIELLSQALQNNPNDVDIMVILGRTYISAKMLEEAEVTFARLLEVDKSRYDYLIQVGRAYLEVGKFDRTIGAIDQCIDLLVARRQEEKAVTLLKTILEYDPNHMQALRHIADIYTRTREDHNLVSTLNLIVDLALRQQQKDEAIEALKKLVEIEPDEQSYKQRLMSLGGTVVEPVKPAKPSYSIPNAFEPVGATVPLTNKTAQGDNQIIERQLREAEMFANRGYADSAAQILEELISQYPNNIEARLKIKQIYIDGGLEEKAASQCLTLAKLYESQGDKALASDLLSEAYDLNPRLKPSGAAKAPARNGQPAPPKLADSIEINLDDALSSDFTLDSPSLSQPRTDAVKTQSTTYQPQASTLSGFNLGGKLENPQMPQGSSQASGLAYGLPELFNQGGPATAPPNPNSGGVGGFNPFSQQSTQPPSSFEMPNIFGQTSPPQPLPGMGAPPSQPASFANIFPSNQQTPVRNIPSVPIGAKGEVPDVQNASFEITIDDAGNTNQLAKDKILKDELDGVDFYIQQGYMEIARSTLEDLEKQHPNHPSILQRFAQMGISRPAPSAPSNKFLQTAPDLEPIEELPEGAILDASSPGTPYNPFNTPVTRTTHAPPPQAPAPIPDALVSKAQSMVPAQSPGASMFDDLISNVEAELDEMPTNDMLPMAKTAPASSSSAKKASTSSAKPSTGSLLDAESLTSLFEEEFVNEFESSDKPDFETHYNLGLAYKDMELFDDAIEQFQLAFKASSPTSGDGNYFNCCNMLGYCFLRNNMARPSAVWYKRGLEAPERSDDEYQAMRFDLADAYEHLNEYSKALECLQEVYALDINYRDVATKIREIQEKIREEDK